MTLLLSMRLERINPLFEYQIALAYNLLTLNFSSFARHMYTSYATR